MVHFFLDLFQLLLCQCSAANDGIAAKVDSGPIILQSYCSQPPQCKVQSNISWPSHSGLLVYCMMKTTR